MKHIILFNILLFPLFVLLCTNNAICIIIALAYAFILGRVSRTEKGRKFLSELSKKVNL